MGSPVCQPADEREDAHDGRNRGADGLRGRHHALATRPDAADPERRERPHGRSRRTSRPDASRSAGPTRSNGPVAKDVTTSWQPCGSPPHHADVRDEQKRRRPLMSALERQVFKDHEAAGHDYRISRYDLELISGGVDIRGIQEVIGKAEAPFDPEREDVSTSLRGIVATSAISLGVDVNSFNAIPSQACRPTSRIHPGLLARGPHACRVLPAAADPAEPTGSFRPGKSRPLPSLPRTDDHATRDRAMGGQGHRQDAALAVPDLSRRGPLPGRLRPSAGRREGCAGLPGLRGGPARHVQRTGAPAEHRRLPRVRHASDRRAQRDRRRAPGGPLPAAAPGKILEIVNGVDLGPLRWPVCPTSGKSARSVSRSRRAASAMSTSPAGSWVRPDGATPAQLRVRGHLASHAVHLHRRMAGHRSRTVLQ